MTPATTFGLVLDVWNTGGTPAYQALAGLQELPPPILQVGEMIDTTTHGSASGVMTSVPSGVLKWPDVPVTYLEDASGTSGVNGDPAQIFCAAQVGTIQKFKVIRANNTTVPVFFNATIFSIEYEPEKIQGKRVLKMLLKPTGVAPSS